MTTKTELTRAWSRLGVLIDEMMDLQDEIAKLSDEFPDEISEVAPAPYVSDHDRQQERTR